MRQSMQCPCCGRVTEHQLVADGRDTYAWCQDCFRVHRHDAEAPRAPRAGASRHAEPAWAAA